MRDVLVVRWWGCEAARGAIGVRVANAIRVMVSMGVMWVVWVGGCMVVVGGCVG